MRSLSTRAVPQRFCDTVASWRYITSASYRCSLFELLSYIRYGLTIQTRHSSCCSCGQHAASRRRLAALRRQRLSSRDDRSGDWNVENRPYKSAFDVYCRCARQPTDEAYILPPASVKDRLFARWRYWSTMVYRQVLWDLENTSWTNYLYQQQQQRQQHRRQVVSARPAPSVHRKPDSAPRPFQCQSCSYCTDRKNNLKRHVTTMHR